MASNSYLTAVLNSTTLTLIRQIGMDSLLSDMHYEEPTDLASRLSRLRSSLFSRKSLNYITLLFIVAAIPLTVFIAGQQQDIRQRAQTVSITPISPPNPNPTPAVVLRIDSGSSASYTDTSRNVWSSDRAFTTGSYGYVGGSPYSGSSTIANTNDDSLYQTTRFGQTFEYRFTVPNGSYQVTFKLAEIRSASCTTGTRVFNISAEGTVIIPNNDTFARVGCATAGDLVRSATVGDGVLNLNFTSVNGPAAVNAIEVISTGVGTTPTPPPPSSQPIRIEAERMTLVSGFRARSGTFASAGSFINLFDTQAATGSATTTFQGASGSYTARVGYFDENDGNAGLQVSVNGQVVDSWLLNEPTSSNSPAAVNARVRTVATPVALTTGSNIRIIGSRGAGDNASIDYIEFSPMPTPTPIPPSPTPTSIVSGGVSVSTNNVVVTLSRSSPLVNGVLQGPGFTLTSQGATGYTIRGNTPGYGFYEVSGGLIPGSSTTIHTYINPSSFPNGVYTGTVFVDYYNSDGALIAGPAVTYNITLTN